MLTLSNKTDIISPKRIYLTSLYHKNYAVSIKTIKKGGRKMLNGKLVRTLMRAKGYSGRELAARVGISESMMSYILQGLREPNVQTLVRIANELGCSLDEMIIR